MNKKVLIDPITKKQIDIFLASNFPCLALIGPNGSGKTTIAEEIVAKTLDPEFNKSGSSVISIDAKFVGIDDVRILQKNLSLSTYGKNAFRRAVIINNFDSFGHEAQNSLLKTLEEPPTDTLIIITINNEAGVLQTIYSRVKKVAVRPISLKQAINELEFPEPEVTKAHILSMGQAGLLVSLLGDKTDHPLIKAIEYAKDLLKKPKYIQIAEVDKIIKNKDIELEVFLGGIFRILNASYGVSVAKNSNIKIAHTRLLAVIECKKDIGQGLSKKLALTRLFLKI